VSPEIQRLLESSGAPFTVHHHAPVVSYEAAKTSLPFDPTAMVKGLAFRLPDGRYAIVAMQAESRADYKKVADALGVRRADLRMATAEEIATDLDMHAGGVVPLPVRDAAVLIDRGVLNLDVVICGSGRNDATLEIARQDLLRIAAAQVEDITRSA
jgi:Cys-tRNA(Pro)/Cys-tRNA(Cys) deacylase